ncbi:MAG: NAD(P)-dependent alcohol dehydrogenase [Spirochaetales bacterium]|nr:MAG: NAD(P)-dependent alcohol dehydrogenase [Spirochaetales bacterium]
MRAVVLNGYGSTEFISLKDVPKPGTKETEVLVRVTAAAVNAGDVFTVKGSPYMLRMDVGFPRPKDHILGWDVSGIVESVGGSASRFKPGDEVYGSVESAFAEYAVGEEILFEEKPRSLTFGEAAALPTAALTALQRMRDGGNIQKGQKVLILGASGGVGSLAVQIARSFGCEVDGVCHSRKTEMVKSLGADRVYAYDAEDFFTTDRRYDLILDNTGRARFSDMKKILTDDGLIIPNSGHGGMAYVIKAFSMAPFDRHIGTMKIVDLKNGDLKVINGLVEGGWVKPHVDRTFRLEETPQAIEYMEQGEVKGKIVITM